MSITPVQAKELLVGDYAFTQLGFSMLITRLRGLYANNTSEEILENSTREINAFLQKYSKIMTRDNVILTKLKQTS